MTTPSEPAQTVAAKRHPFSLRPNKQEAVVTAFGASWQSESGPKCRAYAENLASALDLAAEPM